MQNVTVVSLAPVQSDPHGGCDVSALLEACMCGPEGWDRPDFHAADKQAYEVSVPTEPAPLMGPQGLATGGSVTGLIEITLNTAVVIPEQTPV